jgi:O-antigen/teichoic acid export membrane protein
MSTVIFGIGIVILLSKELGSEDFGLWVAVFSIFQITSIMNFGFPTLIVRDAARRPEELSGILKVTRRAQILLGALAIPSSILLSLFFYGNQINGEWAILIVGFAYIFTVLQEINRAGLRSLGQAPKEVFITLLDRGAVFFLFVYLGTLNGASIASYAIAYNVGPILGFILSYILVSRLGNYKHGTDPRIGEILRNSAPFGVGIIARPFRDGGLRVLLSITGGFTVVAVFDIAWKAYTAGSSVTVAIRKSMLPRYSSASRSNNNLTDSLDHGYRISKWIVQFGLFFGVASSFLIPFLFANDYSDSQLTFILLLSSWGLMTISSTWVVGVESLLEGRKYAILMLSQLFITMLVAIILSWGNSLYAAIFGVISGELLILWQSFRMIGKNGSFPMNYAEAGSFILVYLFLSFGYAFSFMSANITFALITIIANLFWMWRTKWTPTIPKFIETRKDSV